MKFETAISQPLGGQLFEMHHRRSKGQMVWRHQYEFLRYSLIRKQMYIYGLTNIPKTYRVLTLHMLSNTTNNCIVTRIIQAIDAEDGSVLPFGSHLKCPTTRHCPGKCKPICLVLKG